MDEDNVFVILMSPITLHMRKKETRAARPFDQEWSIAVVPSDPSGQNVFGHGAHAKNLLMHENILLEDWQLQKLGKQ